MLRRNRLRSMQHMEPALNIVLNFEGNLPMRKLVSWHSPHQLNVLGDWKTREIDCFPTTPECKARFEFFDPAKTRKAYFHSFTLVAPPYSGFWISAVLNAELLYKDFVSLNIVISDFMLNVDSKFSFSHISTHMNMLYKIDWKFMKHWKKHTPLFHIFQYWSRHRFSKFSLCIYDSLCTHNIIIPIKMLKSIWKPYIKISHVLEPW